MSSLARLSSLIGLARVKEVIFSARLIEAPEALGIGLLAEVVEDAAALAARAEELARLYANHAPLTLRATKEGLRRLQSRLAGAEAEDLITMCYTSQDFREGMEAFFEKRAPRWTGK
jgi:enoyl-CoA hydratase/carnithine racemase